MLLKEHDSKGATIATAAIFFFFFFFYLIKEYIQGNPLVFLYRQSIVKV